MVVKIQTLEINSETLAPAVPIPIPYFSRISKILDNIKIELLYFINCLVLA